MKEGLDALQGVVDAILADMVGEATFIAAIAEINLAIATLGEELSATIGVLGVAIGGAIAAQTAALIAEATTSTNSIIAAINNVSAQISTILTALNTANSTLTTLLSTTIVISNKMDGLANALSLILGAINDALTYLVDINSRIQNIYNLLDLRLLQIQTNLDLIRDSNSDISFHTATTAARVQNLYELTVANDSAELTALNTIVSRLDTLHLDNSASFTLLAQIRDNLNAILTLLSSPVGPSEPILYNLIYSLYEALSPGGYYDFGFGTLRVKNV